MKLERKLFIIISFIIAMIIIVMPNKVSAALQANGGAIKTLNLDSWILPIRKMQELGGTLGRTDIINTDNFTSNATDLDIHLQKNTEYGAMAILSASAYGNPNKINAGETTTGNPTGVVLNGSREYTASHINGTVNQSYAPASNYHRASSRYKNIYNGSIWKHGDAIDIYNWHSGTRIGIGGYTCFLRNAGSIFGIASGGESSAEMYTHAYSARAAIVVGSDL